MPAKSFSLRGWIGQQRTERDQSNMTATLWWVFIGQVTGIHTRTGLWNLANISCVYLSKQPLSLFLPSFLPIIPYLFLPPSPWMMIKSTPSPCLCPCVKHFFPSCLGKNKPLQNFSTEMNCLQFVQHLATHFSQVRRIYLCLAVNDNSVLFFLFYCFAIVVP